VLQRRVLQRKGRLVGIVPLVFAPLCVACTTKVTTNIVRGAETERRNPVESGPIGSSTWQWNGQEFTGNVEWRTCRMETSWKETEQQTRTTRTTAAVPVAVVVVGLAILVTGFATYDYDGVQETCNTGLGLCYEETADNTASSLLMLGGAAVMGLGVGMTAIKTKPQISDGKTEQKTSSREASCIQPQDLDELKLVLQISERKFVTFQVNRDGSARIRIPKGVEVPREVELPVLVYRVPRNTAHFVDRWSLVGHARAPAD
jgi:hypothetical protein